MRRLLLLLLAAACARPAPRDRVLPDVEVRLQRIELSRAPSAEVRALLASPEAPIRARAALAAGRIGDSGAAPDLTALLADPETAEPAAWALGRIEGGSEALVHCLDARCPAAPFAAPALSGPAAREAAFSLGVLARNKEAKFPAEAHARLALALTREDARAGAAYA